MLISLCNAKDHVLPCNLLGLDLLGLSAFCEQLGENKYRAQQLAQWIHLQGKHDFNMMTNFNQYLKHTLKIQAVISVPKVLDKAQASDGTCKWLLQLQDGQCIETVFIPEKHRGTLCISSQVGCALHCDFCWTGKQGFQRHLTTAEIIGQLWFAVRELSQAGGRHDRKVTNVVMMGMGEPLLNLDQLLPALNIMRSDYAYGLSKYRITVSTAGVIPAIYALSQTQEVALAVSLHAPTDLLRNQLVPINKKYPLADLMAACKTYYRDKRRAIMFEYVMLKDVNDTLMHARQLIRLLQNMRAKINLIPFNSFPQSTYQTSSMPVIRSFSQYLMRSGLHTTIRKTRGESIFAACGQLSEIQPGGRKYTPHSNQNEPYYI